MAKAHVKKRIAGNIVVGLWVLVSCLMQTSVFLYFKIFGSVPQLTLITLAVFARYGNRNLICTYAVAGGFILGCLGGESVILYPLTYLLAVCVSMVVSEMLNFMPILASLGSVFIACFCDGLISCAVIMMRFSEATFFSAFVNSALPSLFYTLLAFLPVYFICFVHKKIFSKTEHS